MNDGNTNCNATEDTAERIINYTDKSNEMIQKWINTMAVVEDEKEALKQFTTKVQLITNKVNNIDHPFTRTEFYAMIETAIQGAFELRNTLVKLTLSAIGVKLYSDREGTDIPSVDAVESLIDPLFNVLYAAVKSAECHPAKDKIKGDIHTRNKRWSDALALANGNHLAALRAYLAVDAQLTLEANLHHEVTQRPGTHRNTDDV